MTIIDTQKIDRRLPMWIVITAAVAGVILGTLEIANTSVGWHLASGRWVIEHGAVPTHDPFSLTSEGVEWVDHEWLFQTFSAGIDRVGGPIALSAVRAAAIAALAILLFAIGVRSGLSPPVALLLSIVCVAAARPRFFYRPELVTLLVVPAAVWLFMTRTRRRLGVWLALLIGIMVIGANAHGGALVVPILLTGILAAEATDMVIARRLDSRVLATGIVGVAASVAALLVNPYGWRLFAVPIHLTELVDQPHIPNPEWIPPTLATAPMLFGAIIIGFLVLALAERQATRWSLFIMACALALRHIRNLGLFFVLWPIAIAPSLATRHVFSREADDPHSRRRQRILACVASLILAVSVAASPWPRFGVGFAPDYFPSSACDFMDRQGLPGSELYNDVRFGGYLIDRYGPTRGVFQDDRNEIHDQLLREIWEIFGRSDVTSWSALLDRFAVDTALIKYHAPIAVRTADGRALGARGFSSLWFPSRKWALVYWDETAMVLVKRDSAKPRLLEDHEYHVIRPDDLEWLIGRIEVDSALAEAALAETERTISQQPENKLALQIRHTIKEMTGSTAP